MCISSVRKYLASLMVVILFTSINGNDYKVTSKKTWTKNESGLVLIYRPAPTGLEATFWTTILGLSMCSIYGGLYSKFFSPDSTGPAVLGGGMVAIFSGHVLWELYYDYNLSHRPVIVMDRSGIACEGKDKIFWKNVWNYYIAEHITRDQYGVIVSHRYSFIISTCSQDYEIDRRLAISLEMLYKLVDEAYKSYKEFEKERAKIKHNKN